MEVNILAEFCIAKIDKTGVTIPAVLHIYLPGSKFQPTSVACHTGLAYVGRWAGAIRSML